MASKSCTFIIVPDATSQCKRYTISKAILGVIGVSSVVILLIIGLVSYAMLNEYGKLSMKMAQLEKLKQISLSQKSTIDRYEQDINQLSQHLASIQELNSRLMILSGLDPAQNEDGAGGVGGAEETDSEGMVLSEESAEQE